MKKLWILLLLLPGLAIASGKDATAEAIVGDQTLKAERIAQILMED